MKDKQTYRHATPIKTKHVNGVTLVLSKMHYI